MLAAERAALRLISHKAYDQEAGVLTARLPARRACSTQPPRLLGVCVAVDQRALVLSRKHGSARNDRELSCATIVNDTAGMLQCNSPPGTVNTGEKRLFPSVATSFSLLCLLACYWEPKQYISHTKHEYTTSIQQHATQAPLGAVTERRSGACGALIVSGDDRLSCTSFLSGAARLPRACRHRPRASCSRARSSWCCT